MLFFCIQSSHVKQAVRGASSPDGKKDMVVHEGLAESPMFIGCQRSSGGRRRRALRRMYHRDEANANKHPKANSMDTTRG